MRKFNWDCLSEEELQEFFKKTNFPDEARYRDEKIRLEALSYQGKQAYTNKQINQLILRKSSKNTVLAVLNNHDEFVNELELTPQNIFDMAANHGGSKNLQEFKNLVAWGAEIARLEGKTRRTQQEALAYALETLNLSIDGAIKVLAHDGGAKNLAALKDLIVWGAEIARLEGKTLCTQQEALAYALKTLNLSIDGAIKVLGNNGGAKNLAALKDLIVWGAEIARLEGKTLRTQQEALAYALETLNLSIDGAIKVLAHGGGAKNLSALKDLIVWGAEIAQLEGKTRRTQQEALAYAFETLNLSIDKLVKILASGGGSGKIHAILSCVKKIKDSEYQIEQIFPNLEELSTLFFTKNGIKELENRISSFFKWKKDDSLFSDLLLILQEFDTKEESINLDYNELEAIIDDFSKDNELEAAINDLFDEDGLGAISDGIAHNPQKRKSIDDLSLEKNQRVRLSSPDIQENQQQVYRNPSTSYSPLFFSSLDDLEYVDQSLMNDVLDSQDILPTNTNI